MPRAVTHTSATRAWLRDRPGLGRHPLAVQLLALAESMDADLREKGRILSAHARTYQQALAQLDAIHDPTPTSEATGSREVTDGSGLFGPGSGSLV